MPSEFNRAAFYTGEIMELIWQKSTQLLANVSVVQESKKYPLLNNKTTYFMCAEITHVCRQCK